MTHPVLLASWGSIDERHVTVGDRLAMDVVREALRIANIPHRVLGAGAPGVDARHGPDSATKVWVCGPVDRSYAPQQEIIADGSGWLLLDTTVLRSRADTGRADLSFARDGAGLETRGDLASLAECADGGFAVVTLRGAQPEYRLDPERAEETARAVTAAVTRAGLVPVVVDTLVPATVSAARAGAGIEAAMGAATVTVTSRLHGCIHALRAGRVPVLIDEVPGGGKVSALASAFELPVFIPVEQISATRIHTAIASAMVQPDGAAPEILHRIRRSAEMNLRRFVECLQRADE